MINYIVIIVEIIFIRQNREFRSKLRANKNNKKKQNIYICISNGDIQWKREKGEEEEIHVNVVFNKSWSKWFCQIKSQKKQKTNAMIQEI